MVRMYLCVFILLGIVTSPAVPKEARNERTDSWISELKPSSSQYQSENADSLDPSLPEHLSENDYSPELLPPVYPSGGGANSAPAVMNVEREQGVTVQKQGVSHDGAMQNSTTTRQQSTNKLCKVPYPEFGTYYKVRNAANSQITDSLEYLTLRVTCGEGYGIADEYGHRVLTTLQRAQCINGEWSEQILLCEPFCRLPPDPSVHYGCEVPGTFWFAPCEYYVAPGTNVKPFCNSPIYFSTDTLPYMKCSFGSWDYVARCKADCGRVTPEGTPHLIGGEQAKRGELPWHAGIYLKTTISYMQVCGGSLIANNVIVSAAHCFWKAEKQLASDYAVAVGKIDHLWDSNIDVDVQRSDVKEIKIPDLFQGSEANFQEDIAVLILATPVVYKTYVRPVCLNFDTNFDRRQLQTGNLGIVAGWGISAANSKASQVLKVVNMPYINVGTCIDTIPLSLRDYITSDKFCAGYTNGTAICKGDSGGGLAFAAITESNIKRYYLRGVVSTAPTQEGKLCNDNTYTTFTKISKHADFIKNSVVAGITKRCRHWQFQCADEICLRSRAECDRVKDCKDGSDESGELCGFHDIPDLLASRLNEFSEIEHVQLRLAPDLPPRTELLQQGLVPVNSELPPSSELPQSSLLLSSLSLPPRSELPPSPVLPPSPELPPSPLLPQRSLLPAGLLLPPRPELPPSPLLPQRSLPPASLLLPPRPELPPTLVPPPSTELPPSPVRLPLGVNSSRTDKVSSEPAASHCGLDCGNEETSAMTETGERSAARTEYEQVPWHVGIYKKSDYSIYCSGSLVSVNMVITAAERFKNQPLLLAGDFAVAAGKLFLPWDDERDVNAQKSDVEAIKVPVPEAGVEDIAFVFLVDQLIYKAAVNPVPSLSDMPKLISGTLLELSGWNQKTGALEVLRMPFIENDVCRRTLPSFSRFESKSHFCTGFTGSNFKSSEFIGGGLVFPLEDSVRTRHFLIGVMISSQNCNNNDYECPFDVNSYFIFADLSVWSDFLARNLPRVS